MYMDWSKNIVFALTLVLMGGVCFSQSKKEDLYFKNNPTKWEIDLPIWIPGVKGQFAYGNFEFEGTERQERERIAKNFGIEFYFGTRFTRRINRVWFLLDGYAGRIRNTFYYQNSNNQNEKQLVEVTIGAGMPRLLAGYSILNNKPDNELQAELIPYIGVRYLNIHLVTTVFDSALTVDVQPEWLEPVFGIYVPITYKRMKVDFMSDLGTNGRNGSWISNILFHYRASKLLSFKAGWAFMVLSYDRQFLNKDLTLGMNLNGPTIGFGFHF